MATSKNDFLFVPFDGSGGNAHGVKRRDKNRHAQMRALRNQALGIVNEGHDRAPKRVQVRFSATDQDGKRLSGPVRPCVSCHKRRNLLKSTDICMQCSKNRTVLCGSQSRGTKHATTLDVIGSTPFPPEVQPAIHSSEPITCQISCGQGCSADRRALHYFLSFAALDLSGYLPVRFWNRLVLQGVQAEPMVRQAVLAVSGAHYDHCTTMTLSAVSEASYQVALRKLQKYLVDSTSPSRELVLICCILLFTFDRLRNNDNAAGVHLKSAMSILTNAYTSSKEGGYRWVPNAPNSGKAVLQELTVILLQMDIEDTIPHLDRGPLLKLEDPTTSAYFKSPPLMTFHNPHEFLEPWMHISHTAWSFIGRNARYRHVPIDTVPDIIVQEREHLYLWFRVWRAGVKEWFAKNPLPSSTPPIMPDETLGFRMIDAINALVLEIHYYSVKGLLIECLDDDRNPHPFDLFAEKMLRCGEKALSLRQAHRQMHSLRMGKTFSIHVGVAESLLTLGHRTTSPAVRIRAQRIVRGFREVSGELTGISDFFAGCGDPPKDNVLIYETPGH